MAPEDYDLAVILRIAKDLVKLNGKSIQMPDVQGTKVRMEGIVEKRSIDREVYRSRGVAERRGTLQLG